MKITVEKNAIYQDGKIVPLPLADTIAMANGYPYVERLCEVHAGQTLVLREPGYNCLEIRATDKVKA